MSVKSLVKRTLQSVFKEESVEELRRTGKHKEIFMRKLREEVLGEDARSINES